jgi:pimeloyl-ACP methyl ester carboxylesterase
MPYAELTGARIFYHQLGSGPDLVMIHGLAANHAFWFTPVGFMLKQRYRLTLVDLRGHGRSSMPLRGYSSLDMAIDLEELLERLQIARPILAGHSFGGNVALHFAARHPDRVAALVVADTRIYALQPAQRFGDVPASSLEEELLRGAGVDAENDEHIGLRLLEEWMAQRRTDTGTLAGAADTVPFGRESLGARGRQRWLDLVQKTTAKVDVRCEAGLTADLLRRVKGPTLAVYGQRSRCLPSGVALAATLDHCTLRVVPQAGHFHPITRPRFLLRVMLGFLRQLSVDPGHAALRGAVAWKPGGGERQGVGV